VLGVLLTALCNSSGLAVKRSQLATVTMLAIGFAFAQVLQGETHSSDWKFYSTSVADGTVTSNLTVFYSNNEIRRLGLGRVQVWTKGLPADEVTAAFNSITKNGEFADRVVRKLDSAHYKPPYGRIRKLTDDLAMMITAWEEIANDDNIAPRMRVLFEFDCPGKMSRELSTWLMINGKPQSDEKPSQWQHIAPETNDGVLATLVCPPATVPR
jgi:hypothetical protein